MDVGVADPDESDRDPHLKLAGLSPFNEPWLEGRCG
jgi:hypothetical protein